MLDERIFSGPHIAGAGLSVSHTQVAARAPPLSLAPCVCVFALTSEKLKVLSDSVACRRVARYVHVRVSVCVVV